MTIYEIAKLAEVSPASVSRVLNNRPGVKPAIREKIKKVIHDNNFTPNLLARELTNNKTSVIGIVMPNINSFFSERIEAINDFCRENNYNIMITSNSRKKNDPEFEINNLEVLHQKRVEGIILFASWITPDNREYLVKLNKKIPLVVVDWNFESVDFPCIIHNNKKSASMVVNHLLSRGHKRIMFISGPDNDQAANDRLEGYKESLKAKNIEIDNNLILKGHFSINSGYRSMKEYIEKKLPLPDALFAANDNMAIGAIKALKEFNYRIPGDISVAGFDDIEISSFITPPLTTVRQDQYETGRIAATTLMDTIAGKKIMNKKILLNQDLINRESVK